MNGRQFISEIQIENNRQRQINDNITEKEFVSFFNDFQYFLKHLHLDSHSWIITNLNTQRAHNQNYYLLKIMKTQFHLYKQFPSKHWDFKYTIASNQLHFNKVIVRDTSPYEFFAQLLIQIELDLLNGQNSIFQKGD
tara:strand:+ start:6252 stop:6662 length:411 start_codon:yes stop_codon:yes gene_type:complete